MGLRHGEDMSPLHTHRLQNAAVAPKDLWVTDMVLLHNANQVTFSLRPDMWPTSHDIDRDVDVDESRGTVHIQHQSTQQMLP